MNSKLLMSCRAMPCYAKGDMFTAADHIRYIVTEIVVRRGRERGERRLVVDSDNARPHPAKVTRAFCNDNFLQIAPHSHPPDSPDSAPSDFFLFLVGTPQKRL
jgi:hypothetical protein